MSFLSMNGIARRKTRSLPGFTLVELLIAMTITLLLMAALGKSFAMIGRTMKKGRSQVTLSSKLRGVSYRLRSDLRNRTAVARPPIVSSSGQGYFLYYEGPLTEHTFGLFGSEPTQLTPGGETVVPGDALFNDAQNSPTYRAFSHYGDFDDYLAFTAEAPGDDWFTGKVPAYLVDDNAADPMAPRIIRSKYAEIIVWASPEWDIDPATNDLSVAAHPAGMPVYRDDDLNLIPDRVRLHQRILLIRPDLNAERTIPPAGASAQQFNSAVLRPMGNSANPDAVPAAIENLYPIGVVNSASTTPSPPAAFYSEYVDAQTATDNRRMLWSNWLVGMAPLHQFFDLSLRRVTHPLTGEPTAYVAANSLEDLTQPHNRFAHVRYPGRFFGRGNFASGTDNATSMPLLALGWNDALLNWQTNDPRSDSPSAPAWFPTGHTASNTLNAVSGSRFGLFNGWLLPHFELGDPNPADPTSAQQWQRSYLATVDRRWDRTGEDVIAGGVLAFDVRAFDPSAPIFTTAGPDGQPGRAGVNDDGLGTAPDDVDRSVRIAGVNASELGAIGSDDVVIGVSDIGISALIAENTLHPTNALPASDLQMLSGRGDFVDIFYPYLGGTALLSRMAESGFDETPPLPVATFDAAVSTNYSNYLQSPFSGLGIPHVALDAIKRSGKLVHSNGGGSICYFQPCYDSWTDAYESDGFDQTQTQSGALTAAQTPAEPYHGTTWTLNDITGVNVNPRIPAAFNPLQIDTGRSIPGELETSPPIPADLEAIQITVRVDDPGSHERMQFSIVEGVK